MNVAFHQVEQHTETVGIRTDHETGSIGMNKGTKETTAVSGGFRWDSSSSVIGNQAYREQKDKTGELLEDASSYDAKNSKDFMVVMSNTLSDEEYQKISENGGNPGDYEPGEMVTILDEIKVTLAQAGVRIAGYTDDLDENAVREKLGDTGSAEAVVRALESKNLPVTEQNKKVCSQEVEKAAQLTELSDGAKKYLLENGLEPTIDSLYKASHVGAGDPSAQPSGYFGTGAEGYFAKKGAPEELSALEDQMKRIVSEAGLAVNEENMADAKWLLKNGLSLTGENLFRLQELNQLTFPIGEQEAALAAADALSVGLSAKEANLTVGDGYQSAENGYIERAQEINEQTQALTEADLTNALQKGSAQTLYQIFQAKNAEADDAAQTETPQTELATTSVLEEAQEAQWVSAKKQLVEIQLHMSAQANLKLMKQGIQIELEPLDQLLKLLEKEESVYHATELADVSEKTEEIKALPAATVGISVQEAWMAKGVFTLQRVYETGSSLAQTYQKAGEAYESLMTAPRADLGDSIQSAFRNVDDLLNEESLEVTEDNRRAVRILGYNHMQISEENIDAVKEADATLQRVLTELTPEKTLRMLRENVNPMEMNLDELADYLAGQTTETEEIDKYSKYLYKLEQNGEITDEEKDAYIGIYRLLRQVEKGDGAAIGTLVSNQQELNLENLLSAVRTRKKGYVDAKIDDAFGLLTDLEKKGTSISDSIYRYYSNKAGQLADELSRSQEGASDFADGDADTDIWQFRSVGEISEEQFHALLSDELPLTANYLFAEQALTSGGGLFTGLFKAAGETGKEKELRDKTERIRQAMSEGEDAVQEAYEDMTKTAGDIAADSARESGNYIDVRSMVSCARQLELMAGHAKKENYYVPVQLNEEWTMLHVQIVGGSGQGKVSVSYRGNTQGEGKAAASFVVKEDHVEGLIGAAAEADLEKYTEIAEKCADAILAETGKKADITCVQSETMDLDAFMAADSKEKQASTKMLYQVAKAFIYTMEQEVATK